jgi:ribosomal protein S18 acetylase RimI-like enzyme
MTESDDSPASFPTPPRTVTDADGRAITIARATDQDMAELVAMYDRFDPADRAQGIPPVEPPAIERWLDSILTDDCVNVVGRHEDRAVAHATLVPDGESGYELAIFVLGEYQGAGIGRSVLETLLGLGAEEGVERVWLTVERWNDAAMALYRSVGFEDSAAQRFDREMTIELDPPN